MAILGLAKILRLNDFRTMVRTHFHRCFETQVLGHLNSIVVDQCLKAFLHLAVLGAFSKLSLKSLLQLFEAQSSFSDRSWGV